MNDILAIINSLTDFHLLNSETLLLIDNKIYDYQGKEVESDVFSRVKAPFAIFSNGRYTKQYLLKEKALKPSTDDSAMMFGGKVPFQNTKKFKGKAILLKDGFIVTGRYPKEVIAAAILIEKMAKTEIVSERFGKVHYINPLLIKIMHFIYQRSYTKKAKEAYERSH